MEYPHLSAMAGRFGDSGEFHFVSISCESGPDETFEGLWRKTSNYFQSAGVNGPAYCDPQAITRRSAAERLQRRSIFYPTSIVVGFDGNIEGAWEGYTPESVDQIESLIDHLLQPP